MSDFQLFARDVEWNDLTVIDKFREEPADELRDKLLR